MRNFMSMKLIAIMAPPLLFSHMSLTSAFIPSYLIGTESVPKSLLLDPPHQQERISRTTLYNAADAWTGGGTNYDSASGTSRLASGGGYGSVEQIEFKIYPDGRVEELVRGVKGNNCHKVTEKINEQLGEVVASKPTEEMYEQEVRISQTLYNTDSTSEGNNDWSSSSSW